MAGLVLYTSYDNKEQCRRSKTLSSLTNDVQSVADDVCRDCRRVKIRLSYKGLTFIDLGVKVNESCYYDIMLSQHYCYLPFNVVDKFIYVSKSIYKAP